MNTVIWVSGKMTTARRSAGCLNFVGKVAKEDLRNTIPKSRKSAERYMEDTQNNKSRNSDRELRLFSFDKNSTFFYMERYHSFIISNQPSFL